MTSNEALTFILIILFLVIYCQLRISHGQDWNFTMRKIDTKEVPLPKDCMVHIIRPLKRVRNEYYGERTGGAGASRGGGNQG